VKRVRVKGAMHPKTASPAISHRSAGTATFSCAADHDGPTWRNCGEVNTEFLKMRHVRLGRYHNRKVRPKGMVAQYLRGPGTPMWRTSTFDKNGSQNGDRGLRVNPKYL
jgi:hypothetical protein